MSRNSLSAAACITLRRVLTAFDLEPMVPFSETFPNNGGDHRYLLRDRDAGVALVFVDRPPGFIDADVVLSDHAGGARAATAHLLAAGHTRIGYLGDRRQIHSAAERLRGHTEALAAAGVAYHPPPLRMELSDSAMARRATEE